MYINSPGGSVTAGLGNATPLFSFKLWLIPNLHGWFGFKGIYDTMQYVLCPVATWCVGQACSMGSLLLAAGL